MFEVAVEALAEALGSDRAALVAAIGPVTSAERLTAAQQLDRIAATERAVHALQAAQARDLAAFAARRLADDEAEDVVPTALQGRGAETEVALATRVATMTADCQLRDAAAAVEHHPRLLALLGTGAVSMVGLRKVLAVTAVLDPPLRRRVDEQLAAEAQRRAWTPGQLAVAAQRRTLAADPRAAAERARRARLRRRVTLSEPYDGVATVSATLRAEEALAVFGVLDRTARGMRADGDERSVDDLMSDLLIESVTGLSATSQRAGSEPAAGEAPAPTPWSPAPSAVPQPDPEPDDPAWDLIAQPDAAPAPAADPPGDPPGDPPPGRIPLRVEVQVVLTAAALLGLSDEPALLRGYGALPLSVAREIVTAAEQAGGTTLVRALFCDPDDGRLLTMQSQARRFTGGLGQFVAWRDQTCRLTGGRLADRDHVRGYVDGGPTAAANAQGLGRRAHVLKDHPGVAVEVLPTVARHDGLDALRVHAPTVRWTLPAGHSHDREPPSALGPGSLPELPPVLAPASAMERHLTRLLAAA